MSAFAVNAVLGFVMVITLCFTVNNAPGLLDTATGYPYIQLFYNVTNNDVGATIMAAIVIINLTTCTISETATASRQIWAFSRDNGLPFSKFLSKVSQILSSRE